MTTNAGPEYFRAREKYEQARSNEEKFAALQEMLRHAPKHKSSEKLVASLTSKIARLRKEMEKAKTLPKRGSGHSINVKKEGDGQIAVIGLPNTGKSRLLRQITGVEVEVAPYPFTTTKPEVGMMDYRGAKIQLVEVPAIVEGSSSGKASGTRLLSLARNADAIIVTYSTEAERSTAVAELEKSGIIVARKKPRITVKASGFRGITVSGKRFLRMSEKELESTLKMYGIHNASVILEEETNPKKLADALDDRLDYKNCLFLNVNEGIGTDFTKQGIFSLLDSIIVYTKKPGHEPDYNEPLVLKKGATVSDLAGIVHKEIAKKLRFARVWGSSKFAGQRVSRDYTLKSGDVVEIS